MVDARVVRACLGLVPLLLYLSLLLLLLLPLRFEI